MKIFLLRHGETLANSLDIMIGSTTDVPLSSNGIKQSQEVKLDSDFDIIFSSPMKRTLQTAEIISKKLNINLIIDNNLIERGKGILEGKMQKEIAEYTEGAVTEAILSKSLEFDFSHFGGDSIESVRVRIKNFVSMILNDYSDKKILVVTHLGIIRVMFAMYENKGPQSSNNAEINVLNISN